MTDGLQSDDMIWVSEWRGDSVRSGLCVRHFKDAEVRDDVVLYLLFVVLVLFFDLTNMI